VGSLLPQRRQPPGAFPLNQRPKRFLQQGAALLWPAQLLGPGEEFIVERQSSVTVVRMLQPKACITLSIS